ncbi:MAG TPA: hypothetical protein VH120_21645 [Gemmataceae bacterium]|jgi:hypothetical protein|nr:hypothetical protein [Gemmataceae bacterium]
MNVLRFDPSAVEKNARESTTEDLLDRVTAFRAGMEPEAIPIIEAELQRRAYGPSAIRHHQMENCVDIVYRPEGFAYKCSFCRRPAVMRRWGWHRLWGLLPILPCIISYCSRHAEAATGDKQVQDEA